MNLLALAKEEIFKIDKAETENDMEYHRGKAMAFAEVLFLRGHKHRDYIQILSETDRLAKDRRARGFTQNNPESDAS